VLSVTLCQIYIIVRGEILALTCSYYKRKVMKMAKSSKKGGMVSENKNNVANMPQEVVYKAYPKPFEGVMGHVYDDLAGIDEQMRGDQQALKKNLSKRKY